MIIKGNVHTLNGPVDIKDLKVGDKVIDFGHRPQEVKNIKVHSVKDAILFKKNKNIMVSTDTMLYTLYGIKNVDVSVKMVLPTGGVANDETVVEEGEFKGYEIEFDGDGIFVENYCVGA